jgi:hypothetical protein
MRQARADEHCCIEHRSLPTTMPETGSPAETRLPRAGAPAETHAWPAETYASHALARWAWRSHEFLVALLLVELSARGGGAGVAPSLAPVAVYGAVDNAARLLLSPWAGQFVDASPRLRGAALMLLLQSASILVSALAAAAALYASPSAPAPPLLLALVVGGGAFAASARQAPPSPWNESGRRPWRRR